MRSNDKDIPQWRKEELELKERMNRMKYEKLLVSLTHSQRTALFDCMCAMVGELRRTALFTDQRREEWNQVQKKWGFLI